MPSLGKDEGRVPRDTQRDSVTGRSQRSGTVLRETQNTEGGRRQKSTGNTAEGPHLTGGLCAILYRNREGGAHQGQWLASPAAPH